MNAPQKDESVADEDAYFQRNIAKEVEEEKAQLHLNASLCRQINDLGFSSLCCSGMKEILYGLILWLLRGIASGSLKFRVI